MAATTEVPFNSPIQLTQLLELGRDYCSDQFGRFFQSKYSQPVSLTSKYEIPSHYINDSERDSSAICVLMNNHIIEIKDFSEIFTDYVKVFPSLDLNTLIGDPRMLQVIKKFKKINDEIVIGHCEGNLFTPYR